MKNKFSQKQIEEIFSTKLKYGNCKWFFHCKNCLPQKEELTEAPRDLMNYELGAYEFTYPNKLIADILVVWCKKSVWDSRHLQPYL